MNDALNDKNVWFAAHLKSFENASTTQLKFKVAKKVILKLLDVYNKALAANSKKDILINKSRDLMEGAAKYLALLAVIGNELRITASCATTSVMSIELADDAAHDGLAAIAKEYGNQQEEIPFFSIASSMARGMEALSLNA